MGSGYMIIFGISMLFAFIGQLVSGRLRSKFKKYSEVGLRSGLSGREVAEKMLRESGIDNVKVISVAGQLTDHYNPTNRTVNLSEPVYNARTVAAAAVAAHECGHAVQHATAYRWLTMRSKIVPVVSVASKINQLMLMGGIALAFLAQSWIFLLVACVTFGITALFSVITLPVEFDASNRALAWLNKSGISAGQEQEQAKDALWWAAMTYVVGALQAIAFLTYFLVMFLQRR